MTKDSITLYFKEGGSDKVYQCSVEEEPGGCVVNFAFGRRGSTLNVGSKTPAPVPYDKAKAIYDKLVREKTAKGYSPGAAGSLVPAPYLATASADTGIHCQLLNPVDEDEAARLLADSSFCAQEKFDGKRMLLRKEGGKVTAINRKGLECGFPAEIGTVALSIPGDFVIDGESVGVMYHAFDVLSREGKDVRNSPYSSRHALLGYIVPNSCPGMTPRCTNFMRIAKAARTAGEKAVLLAELRKAGKEGIVFKRMDAPYVPGRPESGGNQLKLKFYATASCIVKGANGTKRSVMLEMVADNPLPPPNRRIDVGKCTIPPNKAVPVAGTVVEIRYLYAYKGGSLYQPTYLGERDDINADACVLSQLKYKAEADKAEVED